MNKFQQWIACLVIVCLAGCGVGSAGIADRVGNAAAENGSSRHIDSPDVWGGEVRCSTAGCMLALVEHELGFLAVYKLGRNGAQLLDKHRLAYHPDFAIWLSDTVLVAAVELSTSLDVFHLENNRLVVKTQIPIGFQPRSVMLLGSQNGVHRMLATPYSGAAVAWVEWDENNPARVSVNSDKWCEAPWFPMPIAKIPDNGNAGLVVACRGDGGLLAVSGSAFGQEKTVKKQLAKFQQVPSMAAVSPAGEWLYVALETGAKNARINTGTNVLQWLDATREGSVAVRVLPDETVVWAEDSRLKLDRFDQLGRLLESRWLPTSGFSTSVQLIDVDGDKILDAVVLNSSGPRSDIIFGPLWDNAKPLNHQLKH